MTKTPDEEQSARHKVDDSVRCLMDQLQRATQRARDRLADRDREALRKRLWMAIALLLASLLLGLICRRAEAVLPPDPLLDAIEWVESSGRGEE